MTKIPAIVYNSTLRTYYRPQDKNATLPKTKISDWSDFSREFNPAKILNNLSIKGFMQKQGEYRQQIVTYNDCAKGLTEAANKLTDEYLLGQKKIILDVDETSGQNVFARADVNASARPAKYDVTVNQLASFQANEGFHFGKREPKPMSAGIYTLGITTGDMPEKQISVYIAQKDNLPRVVQKFSNAINASGVEIAAQTKETSEELYLYLRTKETGANNSFTIRDINGNAAEMLGLHNVKQPAANTRYNVNGVNRESFDNTISLDYGNVVLKVDGEDGGARIVVAPDYGYTLAAVEQFAGQYNKLHSVLTNSANISGKGEKLLAGIETLINKVRKDDFENIGISIDNYTGLIEIEKDKLLEAITNEPIKVDSLFNDKPGLGSITKSLAKTASLTPLGKFIKSPTMLDSIDYGWRWRGLENMDLMSAGAFAYFNQGMFFDIFI